MRRLFGYLVLSISGVFLLSCSNDEGGEVATTLKVDVSAVSFGADSYGSTRGVELDQTKLQEDGFGVIGFSSSLDWASVKDEAIPNFMYNQKVVYAEDIWSYSPLVYWNNFEYHTFFAYSPYESTAMQLSGSDYVGTPTIAYSVSESPKDMVDMVTDQFVDKTDSDGALQYSFKHQLTRLNLTSSVYIESGADAYIEISNLHITSSSKMYMSGLYTFADQDGEYGTWELSDQITGNYLLSDIVNFSDSESQTVRVSESVNLFVDGEYLFLLPVNGTAGIGADDNFEIGFDYKIMLWDALLEDYAIYKESSSSVSMPDGSMAQGESYIYNIKFSITSVEFAGAADDWANPDYITPDSSYVDEDNNGAYELGDIVVGGDVAIDVESNSDLVWESSDESVATVDEEGNVTGVGGGTATITCTSENGVEVSFEVTVWTPISGATLSPTTLTLTAGDSSTLTAGVTYGGTSNPEAYTVTWSTSSSSYATVSSGTVKGVAAGSATITVTITGSVSGLTKSATCAVTVEAGATYNYSDLSAGQYVTSAGTVSSSSSGAVAVIYYVDATEGYALAASLSITKTTSWCPSSFTSSYIGATSTTDGYSNSAKMYAQSTTSSSSTNPVYYAKYKGKITAAYDGKGRGEFYIPSRREAYVFISRLYNGTSSITMSGTSYTTDFNGYSTSSIYSKHSSVYGSIAYIVTSTETSSSQCNIVAGDGSGATTNKLKASYRNLATSTWTPTVYIVPIVKL